MLFTYLLAGLASAAALVQGMAIDIEARGQPGGCNIAQAAFQQIVGGKGGKPMCESAWPVTNFINYIQVWSNSNTITAMQIGYQNGNKVQYGKGFGGTPKSITLAPGELVTSAYLTGNGVGTRLGKIHIETNKGQVVDLGQSTATPYNIQVGSGLIIGMFVQSDKEIDAAGLVMLGGKITKIGISNFKFNQDPTLNGPPLQPQALSKVHYYNDDTSDQTYNFQGSQAVTNTNSYSSSTTGEFGMEFSWEAEVNLLALDSKVGGKISWSVSHTTMSTTTSSTAETLTWQQAGKLSPGHGVDCQAVVQTGTGDFPYTALMTIYLDNGNKISYNEPGVLHSVQYTTVDQHCSASNGPASADKNFVVKNLKKTH